MRYPSYPEYKPSSIQWLGKILAHWDVTRLKYRASYRSSSVDKTSAEGEIPVRLCNYTDVYYSERIHPGMPLMETTANATEIRRYRLRAGDVVITKDSEDWRDIAVSSLVAKEVPDLVCGYHLGILRPTGRLLGTFLHRALQSRAMNSQFQIAASGVTRYGLPNHAVGGAWIALPPTDEQRLISDFLDRATEKLDALIAKKSDLIQRLREKRAALIFRTVACGLSPDAARAVGFDPHPVMKPSGADWLGMIPEHWRVVPLGYAVRFVGGATPDKSKPEYWDGAIPWVSPKDMKRPQISEGKDHISPEGLTNSPLRMIPVGSVLIVVRGMILAHSFPVAMCAAPLTINQDMKALLCGAALDPEYLFWVLTGASRSIIARADESAHGTRKLETEVLSKFRVTVPPVAEQRALASFLQRETAKLDHAIAAVRSATERLLEYRARVITAAVVGEIDVRGSKP